MTRRRQDATMDPWFALSDVTDRLPPLWIALLIPQQL